MEYYCVTVRYPLAQLIVEGYKTVELRSWRPKDINVIAIHCGKARFDGSVDLPKGFVERSDLKGKLIGIVDIIEVRPAVEADAAKALVNVKNFKFSWVLGNPRLLADPTPLSGKLGLFKHFIEETT